MLLVGGLFFGGLIDRTEAWASHISPNAGDASPLRSGNTYSHATTPVLPSSPLHRPLLRESFTLMAVLSDGNRQLNRGMQEVCTSSAVCRVYLPGSEQHNHVSWATFVTQKEYFPESLWPSKSSKQCCRHQGTPQFGKFSDGSPQVFFCDEHRRVTFASQYRFLAAAADAKQVMARAQVNILPDRRRVVLGSQLAWLLLVDDDTVVHPEPLDNMLDSLNTRAPQFLGDVDAQHEYICGGSGSLFSKAAVSQIGFADCALAFRNKCMQSDWMLAACARLAQVPLRSYKSCSICRAVKPSSHVNVSLAYHEALIKKGCGFAQVTMKYIRPKGWLRGICRQQHRVALVHGLSEEDCAKATSTGDARTDQSSNRAQRTHSSAHAQALAQKLSAHHRCNSFCNANGTNCMPKHGT